MMERTLRKCKARDVTLVVAAGNDGAFRTLDTLVPQAFGTDDRFSMITVGGVDQTGKYYRDTVQGKGEGGQVDIYADAVQVVAAKHDDQDDSTTTVDGTSAAAPAIVSIEQLHLISIKNANYERLDLLHICSASRHYAATGTTGAYRQT
jgi:hypothetical protein